MVSSSDSPGKVHYLHASMGKQTCDSCGATFDLRYAFQRVTIRSEARFACSQACRQAVLAGIPRKSPEAAAIRIAVLNQKGGTGKTTTAVNLAAGLSDAGKRVLLVDMDSQGHVGESLGVRHGKTLYHLICEGAPAADCIVRRPPNLDVITATESLAAAEILLARMDRGRERILRSKLGSATGYDYVILDCGPSLSLLNQNALTYVDEVLVPVQCEYLSLVGVRQLLRTIRMVNEQLQHPVEILGVLPTFYDQRNKISDEALKAMRTHFPNRVLPAIRVNARLKEAPSHKKSIFEYDPDSRGADDYRRIVRWVLNHGEEKRSARPT